MLNETVKKNIIMYSLNSSINVNLEKERLEVFANPIKHFGTNAYVTC